MDGCFLQANASGRSHCSRAHEHAIPQSVGPHLNVCCDLCYPCAFISHVWSPFHGCQSQPGIHRFRSGFHEPKTSHAHTQMLWRRWFHLDAVNTSVWQASMFLWLYLRTPGFQGRILCVRNISPMASEDSAPYFCELSENISAMCVCIHLCMYVWIMFCAKFVICMYTSIW
jgi:hypothetical protein